MTLPRERMYDSDAFEVNQWIIPGVAVAGTLLGTVATTATANTLFTVPTGMVGRMLAATFKLTNGGTGAATAPLFGVSNKMDGTGAIVIMASAVYGTRADTEAVQLVVDTAGTNNHFSADDVVTIAYIAGTVADASQIFSCTSFIWQEIAT